MKIGDIVNVFVIDQEIKTGPNNFRFAIVKGKVYGAERIGQWSERYHIEIMNEYKTRIYISKYVAGEQTKPGQYTTRTADNTHHITFLVGYDDKHFCRYIVRYTMPAPLSSFLNTYKESLDKSMERLVSLKNNLTDSKLKIIMHTEIGMCYRRCCYNYYLLRLKKD